jgi:hypothetical protein
MTSNFFTAIKTQFLTKCNRHLRKKPTKECIELKVQNVWVNIEIINFIKI